MPGLDPFKNFQCLRVCESVQVCVHVCACMRMCVLAQREMQMDGDVTLAQAMPQWICKELGHTRDPRTA